MTNRHTARAFSNVALVKYWGKQGSGNAPATPSISLTLNALETTAQIQQIKGRKDVIKLPGEINDEAAQRRVQDYLDIWRKAGLISGRFQVETYTNYPVAAGLASSASSFAALAKALSEFSESKLSDSKLSKLARLGSGSAARSILGGLSALPAGDDPAATLLNAPDDVPWGMVVAVASGQRKIVGSREGMDHSRRTSPFYAEWLKQSEKDYRAMRAALKTFDLDRVGEIMEANMLAMHAVMTSSRPPLLYWNPATVHLVKQISAWRQRGVNAYATIDAGPNVVVLCSREQLDKVTKIVSGSPGIVRTIRSLPGGAAQLI